MTQVLEVLSIWTLPVFRYEMVEGGEQTFSTFSKWVLLKIDASVHVTDQISSINFKPFMLEIKLLV